jgi:hypothetical protein
MIVPQTHHQHHALAHAGHAAEFVERVAEQNFNATCEHCGVGELYIALNHALRPYKRGQTFLVVM